MRLRTILMGFVALLFGLTAASSVYLLGAPSNKAADHASIVIVTADVPRGSSLTAEMVALRDWPKGFLPDGVVTRTEDAIGRTVGIPLVEGEPVLQSKLAAKEAGRGIAALVPRGMRAVTILTPNVSTGVAGFVLPGNTVDVLLTLSHVAHDDVSGGGGTLTLLQNVEILAVDQRIEAPSENLVDPKELRSVTLLVSPNDAAKLDLGQNKGTLSLALRNPEDTATEAVSPATLAELRGMTPTASSALASIPDDQPAALTAVPVPESPVPAPEPVVAAEPALPAAAPVKPSPSATAALPPIRTLRGGISGLVHVRRAVE